MLQRHGTEAIGTIFGLVMVLWFLALGAAGHRWHLPGADRPRGPQPGLCARVFGRLTLGGFLALGAVFLAVTGGEALYADMGHLGRGPIRLAWFVLVLPSLMLNYLGQGATSWPGTRASATRSTTSCPRPMLVPVVILATVATIIASQAVVSGAFSLTRQAIQLPSSRR